MELMIGQAVEENKEETKEELIDYFNSVVPGYDIGSILFDEEEDEHNKEGFDQMMGKLGPEDQEKFIDSLRKFEVFADLLPKK